MLGVGRCCLQRWVEDQRSEIKESLSAFKELMPSDGDKRSSESENENNIYQRFRAGETEAHSGQTAIGSEPRTQPSKLIPLEPIVPPQLLCVTQLLKRERKGY